MLYYINQSSIFKTSLFLVLFAVFGCGTSSKNLVESLHISPLSHFDIQDDLLVDGDMLRLLYCSWNTNDDRIKEDNYVQVIAIKIKTNDTINILTNFETKFLKDDGDRTFVYTKYNIDYKGIVAQQKAEFLKNKDKALSTERFVEDQNRSDVYNFPNGPNVYIDGTMMDIFTNNYPFTIGRMERL